MHRCHQYCSLHSQPLQPLWDWTQNNACLEKKTALSRNPLKINTTLSIKGECFISICKFMTVTYANYIDIIQNYASLWPLLMPVILTLYKTSLESFFLKIATRVYKTVLGIHFWEFIKMQEFTKLCFSACHVIWYCVCCEGYWFFL